MAVEWVAVAAWGKTPSVKWMILGKTVELHRLILKCAAAVEFVSIIAPSTGIILDDVARALHNPSIVIAVSL